MALDKELVDFMTDAAQSLGRIEQFQADSAADRRGIHEELTCLKDNCAKCMTRLPLIESGLNNHIATHDRLLKYVAYPVLVAVILASMATFGKLVLHIF